MKARTVKLMRALRDVTRHTSRSGALQYHKFASQVGKKRYRQSLVSHGAKMKGYSTTRNS